MIQKKSTGKNLHVIIGLPVRAMPNQEMRSKFSLCQKRQNGGCNSQKAFHVPSPLQWGQFLQGGDGSFQVIWQTYLEVDLEQTKTYCV